MSWCLKRRLDLWVALPRNCSCDVISSVCSGNARRFSRSRLRDPRISRDPIDFPRFAAVVRERLFEMHRVRGDVGDHEAHENRAALERFLVVEFTTSVLELADRGLRERAVAAIGEIQTPLLRRRIVEAKAEAFEIGRAHV